MPSHHLRTSKMQTFLQENLNYCLFPLMKARWVLLIGKRKRGVNFTKWTPDMPIRAIEIWNRKPRSYNEFRSISEVFFVNANGNWPSWEFSSKRSSMEHLGFRLWLEQTYPWSRVHQTINLGKCFWQGLGMLAVFVMSIVRTIQGYRQLREYS